MLSDGPKREVRMERVSVVQSVLNRLCLRDQDQHRVNVKKERSASSALRRSGTISVDSNTARWDKVPAKERHRPVHYRFFSRQRRHAALLLEKPVATMKRPSVIIHHPPWKVPTINDEFPNLEGVTQDNSKFDLYEYKGSQWGMIFTHPVDFTPVCTSEFVELLKLKPEFDAFGVKIVGFSTNDCVTHRVWLSDVEAIVNGYPTELDCEKSSGARTVSTTSTGSNTSLALKVDFPIYSDPTLEMAVELGILDEYVKDDDGLPVTARSVYILTPSNKIAVISTYPTNLGRNWREVLRCIQALQLVEESNDSIQIPSQWEKGDKVLIDPKWSDLECDTTFGAEKWERLMLPSEVQREIATFTSGDGGVRIKTRDGDADETAELSVLPRHYMRYTNFEVEKSLC